MNNKCMFDLRTDRGEVIHMGRVKIHKTPSFNFEIPLLSFVVIRRDDGSHIATCIHLLIDGYGATAADASNDMISNIYYFLRQNFTNEECKEFAWENLYDMYKSSKTSGILWDKYHALQINDAMNGISTDMFAVFHNKIKALEEKMSDAAAKHREELQALENELEKMRTIEANLNEKIRKLEVEICDKEDLFTYWIVEPMISKTESIGVV